jgi:hypothetical protein
VVKIALMRLDEMLCEEGRRKFMAVIFDAISKLRRYFQQLQVCGHEFLA